MTVKFPLEGQTFGSWKVLGLASTGKRTLWNCECVCGALRQVDSNRLRSGRSTSCGCMRPSLVSVAQREHLARGTRLYQIWLGMRQRCNNPRHQAWDRYGGRGIKVCPEWEDFSQFVADMGEPPIGCSIERIDNDAGYSPANCVWASRLTQANNREVNRRITAHGKTLTLAQWGRELGLRPGTISGRLARGIPADEALTPGLRKQGVTP